MKTYDLKPTYENLYQTFLNDAIDRNNDVFKFVEILNSINDSCSIAIDGNWGSGKTFFVNQVKMVIDASNPYIYQDDKEKDRLKINEILREHCEDNPLDLNSQFCVYYDAWKNDNDIDPIISLVYEIIRSTGTEYSFKETDWSKISTTIGETLLDLGSQCLPILNIPKIDLGKLVEGLKGDDPIRAIKEQKGLEESVYDFFDGLLVEKGNRLVVFIDELDRCNPSYAVRLLERIKHYFSDERITFVFSVSLKQLQHTIKKHYGAEFDASRYLDRFFDLRMTLPEPNLKKFYESIGLRDNGSVYYAVCFGLIERYHLELREIARFIRIAKIAGDYYIKLERQNVVINFGISRQFSVHCIVPIMLVLKICDIELYTKFIEGKDGTPLIEISKYVQKQSFFDYLLEDNETYDKYVKDGILVKIEDKVEELYEAIFIKNYIDDEDMEHIGKMRFDKNIKRDLLRTAGLFSEYTKFDIE